jgi:cell pole-organizing protein PopZ
MRQDGEASVEEILESIKKVIARDNRSAAFDVRRRRENEGVSEAPAEVAPEPADADEAEEVLDLAAADFVEQAPDEYLEEDDFEDDNEVAEDNAPLVTEAARASMRDNLAALALLSEPSMPPQIVRSGETSLEGLTRDLLRPMLSDWLDKNLPEMVERMVKDEIARIAGKRG